MTNPITGPYYKYVDRWNVGGYVLSTKTSTSYRQQRPYDLPLPFYQRDRYTTKLSSWPHQQADNSSGGVDNTKAFSVDSGGAVWGDTYVSSLLASLGNRLVAKFQDKMSNPASTLTALVESQSTISMIEKRLVQMLTFTTRWKQRRFKEALTVVLNSQSFKSPSKERRRKRKLKSLRDKPAAYWGSKSLASAWIETWFGWLPSIGDVKTGVAALSRDLPFEYITVKTAMPFEVSNNRATAWSCTHKGLVWGQCGATVYVTNPNLYLASQLGLTNPIYTAFEVLPYSWLLAWFNNLEQFFRQFSAFHGVTVDRPWKTFGMRDVVDFWWPDPGPGSTGGGVCTSFQRSLGLPGVTLQWKGVNRLSVTRGATLASLLALRLPRR